MVAKRLVKSGLVLTIPFLMALLMTPSLCTQIHDLGPIGTLHRCADQPGVVQRMLASPLRKDVTHTHIHIEKSSPTIWDKAALAGRRTLPRPRIVDSTQHIVQLGPSFAEARPSSGMFDQGERPSLLGLGGKWVNIAQTRCVESERSTSRWPSAARPTGKWRSLVGAGRTPIGIVQVDVGNWKIEVPVAKAARQRALGPRFDHTRVAR